MHAVQTRRPHLRHGAATIKPPCMRRFSHPRTKRKLARSWRVLLLASTGVAAPYPHATKARLVTLGAELYARRSTALTGAPEA